MGMKGFEKQLDKVLLTQAHINDMRRNRIETLRPVGKDSEENITPKSMYKEPFKPGDRVLYFAFEEDQDALMPPKYGMSAVLERELDKLKKEWKFIKMWNIDFPLLERK